MRPLRLTVAESGHAASLDEHQLQLDGAAHGGAAAVGARGPVAAQRQPQRMPLAIGDRREVFEQRLAEEVVGAAPAI